MTSRLTPTRAGRVLRAAATIAAVAWPGCSPGGGHPPVYPVRGKVTHQGKPIAAGSVLYELDAGLEGPPAWAGSGPFRVTARIQPDGTFQLRAFPDADGMPEGRYKVGITSRPGRSEKGLFDAAKAPTGDPDVLRGRYADPTTSGLKGEVAKDRPHEPSFDLP